MKSPKENALERNLFAVLPESTKSGKLIRLLCSDKEIQEMQEYANSVSIIRLGFNDHGPVHMRQVTINAIKMFTLLNNGGIKGSLEHDNVGTSEDSLCAVILASFLHDIGMAIGREDHELLSSTLAISIITRLLEELYPESLQKRVIIRSIALEGIVGHMANRKIHSIEAGLILIADGCDMEKGRARIPLTISQEAKVGDIHKYSSNAIEKVLIEKGETKPISIHISMSNEVGFFQVEEVLYPKIRMSPVKQYIELYAGIIGQEDKQYL
jgi:metal-dependent HD superfamily phosphatase/phosphodiesterase